MHIYDDFTYWSSMPIEGLITENQYKYTGFTEVHTGEYLKYWNLTLNRLPFFPFGMAGSTFFVEQKCDKRLVPKVFPLYGSNTAISSWYREYVYI